MLYYPVLFYLLLSITILAFSTIHATELKDLIQRLKQSDSAAFKSVFDLFYPSTFRFLQFKLNDDDLAKDIIQDVFIKIWENRSQLEAERSFKSYLYKIANNRALKHFRHEKVVRKYEQAQKAQPQPHADSPETLLEHQELAERLQKAIRQLPEKPRTVYLMSRVEKLSYKEIAERLNISVKTVETHIGNSLKALRSVVVK